VDTETTAAEKREKATFSVSDPEEASNATCPLSVRTREGGTVGRVQDQGRTGERKVLRSSEDDLHTEYGALTPRGLRGTQFKRGVLS